MRGGDSSRPRHTDHLPALPICAVIPTASRNRRPLSASSATGVRNPVFVPPVPNPVERRAEMGTQRFPGPVVHGRGPLTRPSAGGQAVEIAALRHEASTRSSCSPSQAAFLASRSAWGLSGTMSLPNTSRHM